MRSFLGGDKKGGKGGYRGLKKVERGGVFRAVLEDFQDFDEKRRKIGDF